MSRSFTHTSPGPWPLTRHKVGEEAVRNGGGVNERHVPEHVLELVVGCQAAGDVLDQKGDGCYQVDDPHFLWNV